MEWLTISKQFFGFRNRLMLAAGLGAAGVLFSMPLIAQQGPMTGNPPTDSPTVPRQQSAPAPAVEIPMGTGGQASSKSASDISKAQPSQPVDQIIQRFAAHESEFKIERDNFTYTQDWDVQTIDDDGRVDGEHRTTSDISYSREGKRQEYVTYAPADTLERVILTPEDMDNVINITPFALTTEDLPKYNVTYVGTQKLDELGTYVFDVAPKTIEKNQRYFQGRIWVEDKDFAIVKTDGKAVPDILKGSHINVYPHFVTYRENIEAHYWFPTYSHSDDFLKFGTDSVHIRETLKFTNYKRFRVSSRIVPNSSRAVDNPPPPSH
jgi:hypothetical protein